MNQENTLSGDFGLGAKVAKDIDQSKIMEKAIYLYDEPDRSFEKYGHLLYPILVKDHYGRIDKGSGYRYWEQGGEFKKFLGSHLTFYPHEEVTQQLNDIFSNELRDSSLHITQNYTSHTGFTNYWEVLSDRFGAPIRDSHANDDVIQVGFIVRNGIGTNVSLGIDFFTMRLICSNGAVARGQDIGTVSISHAGNYNLMRQKFAEAIPNAIKFAEHLIEYYQRSVYVKMNQAIAEQLYRKMPVSDGHFPEYFNINKDELKKTKPDISKVVNFKRENMSLWQTFNDFTADLWHSNRLQFSGKRYAEIALHKELIQVVEAQRA